MERSNSTNYPFLLHILFPLLKKDIFFLLRDRTILPSSSFLTSYSQVSIEKNRDLLIMLTNSCNPWKVRFKTSVLLYIFPNSKQRLKSLIDAGSANITMVCSSENFWRNSSADFASIVQFILRSSSIWMYRLSAAVRCSSLTVVIYFSFFYIIAHRD